MTFLFPDLSEADFRKALESLEAASPARLELVDAPPKRRAGTCPDPNQRLRFV